MEEEKTIYEFRVQLSEPKYRKMMIKKVENPNLKERLIHLNKDGIISQDIFANVIGVKKSSIESWEQSKRTPLRAIFILLNMLLSKN